MSSGVPGARHPRDRRVDRGAVEHDVARVDRRRCALGVGHLRPELVGGVVEDVDVEHVVEIGDAGAGRDVGELLEAEAVRELVQQHGHQIDVVAVIRVEPEIELPAAEARSISVEIRVEPRADLCTRCDTIVFERIDLEAGHLVGKRPAVQEVRDRTGIQTRRGEIQRREIANRRSRGSRWSRCTSATRTSRECGSARGCQPCFPTAGPPPETRSGAVHPALYRNCRRPVRPPSDR